MDYTQTMAQLQAEGLQMPKQRLAIRIPNAREELKSALNAVCQSLGEKMEWLPEYEQVAEWLIDNEGKGLLLYGVCGRGKSLLVRFAIPMIIRQHYNRIFAVVDCVKSAEVDVSDILKRKFVALDDIGAEEVQNDYGTKRKLVPEIICSAHDDAGKLLIASTNLDGDQLLSRYGNRIYDRIIYLFKRVQFTGTSLRK